MKALVRRSVCGVSSMFTKRHQSKLYAGSIIRHRLIRNFAVADDHSRGAQFNLKPKVCYYKVLNVATGASEIEIKQAYQKLVKRLHPDINPGSEEQFREVIDAYSVLSDPAKKELYDTSIGIFDPDWGKQDSQRFWTGDHKARMDEELSKLKGSIFYPTPEQEKYYKGELPSDKDKRLTDSMKKQFREKEKEEEESKKEDYLMVNGKQHNADELHSYFQAKYFKNPDVETVNPKEKLRFTKTIYNKVQERKQQTNEDMMIFESEVGRFKVSKKAEDKIKSPVETVVRLTAPFVFVAMLFVGMFAYVTEKPKTKNELKSKHISHGEGYMAKFTPT